MKKYTQKQLKALVNDGAAVDITSANIEKRQEIEAAEGNYTQVGYSSGVYGCNGALLRGNKTGTLYAITGRTSALFIFV